MYRLLIVLTLLCGTVIAQGSSGLDIYFVRHAETQANLTGNYDSASSNTFSAQGHKQIEVLNIKLQPLHFDAILVSSLPRALDTILPYLQQSRQTAEVWPELAECCWQHPRDNSNSAKAVTASAVLLSSAQKPFFSFRDDDSIYDYSNNSYAEGVAHVHKAVELIRQRYMGSSKTILIVAHYHSGQVLLAELLGISREQLPPLQNGELTHLHQDEAGHFTLVSINGREPVEQPLP